MTAGSCSKQPTVSHPGLLLIYSQSLTLCTAPINLGKSQGGHKGTLEIPYHREPAESACQCQSLQAGPHGADPAAGTAAEPSLPSSVQAP